jgi:uncharacterized protein (TIGR03663 family)
MTETTAADPLAPTSAPQAASGGRRTRFRRWLLDRDKREAALWIGLLVIAILLRCIDLGHRAFHHDESQDAYFSFQVLKDFGAYEYNPLLHGPFRFFLTAFIFKVFGASDFTARLAPATMGTIVVVLPYLLRHKLGRVAAFAAGVMFAIGPTFLYFSRFAREDIYLAAVVLGMIVAAFRFIENPRALTLSITTALAALSFAVKESGGVMVAILLAFAALAVVVQGLLERRRGNNFFDGEVASAVRAVGWVGWMYAIATALVVYGAMFTSFFTHTSCTSPGYSVPSHDHQAHETSCLNGLFYGIEYWKDQQEVGRGDDPAWLYAAIVIGHEWPVLLMALVGILATLLRPTTVRCFLVFYFVGVAAFHALGKERFAWLVLHPLLPMILLAGIGVQFLWELRSRVARAIGLVAVALGFAYMVIASFNTNARMATDPRSMLVSTQSSQQAKDVSNQIIALDRKWQKSHKGQHLTISIDASEGATFPYAWYLRDLSAGFPVLQGTTAPPTSQILVLTDAAEVAMLPNLAAYEGRKFDFRIWWIKKPYSKSIGDWKDWFLHHKPWSATGGMTEHFYVRRDVGDLPGKGTKSEIPPPAPPPPAPSP